MSTLIELKDWIEQGGVTCTLNYTKTGNVVVKCGIDKDDP